MWLGHASRVARVTVARLAGAEGEGPGWRSMTDAGGGQGTPSGDEKLAKEPETLATFRNRIEEVLSKLEKSSASPKSIGDHKIADDAFGTGFDSAKALATLYEAVHVQLLMLSNEFGDHVDAMGLAAVIADQGYDGIDAEEAARLRAIQERARGYERDRPGATGGATTKDAPGTAGTGGGGVY
jgi:hypothetical protein